MYARLILTQGNLKLVGKRFYKYVSVNATCKVCFGQENSDR